MKPTGLLIAAGLLAVLGGLVWWSNRNQKDEAAKPAAGTTTTKILTLADADVTRIDLRRTEGETTTLERAPSGEWKINTPQAYAADSNAVSSLLTALGGLTADKVVEEKPSDLTAFGLAKPSTEIVATLKGGKTRKVYLGDDTPVGGGSFVRVDGDARVFTVSSMTKNDLNKKAADLRDKRLLTFDAAKLARIELTAKGSTLEFSRNNQNEWTIIKPKPIRADNWQVEDLVRRLQDLKLDPTLDDTQRKDVVKQFAASAPVATIAVTGAAGTQKLELRKSKENRYYAMSSAIEGSHLLTEDTGKSFDKTADDFRNKKLFDFAFSDPARVEYKDATRTLALNKAGERWLSGSKPMDAVGVQNLIDRLRDLSAVKFPDTGFTTPAIELTVVSKEGKLTEKVSISKAGDKFIARREGEPSLYELDTKAVGELQSAATSIKEQPAAAKK